MTPPQLRAATSDDRLSFVKAGPGSGKTFTAAEAFGYLRHVRYRADPRGICGVTFARSARKELTTRVRQRWGNRLVQWPNLVCTFDEIHRRIVRYLVHRELINWPGGGTVPDVPEDSWTTQPGVMSRPGRTRARFRVGLDDDGVLTVLKTKDFDRAPAPAFVEGDKLEAALTTGTCTHTDVRNLLSDAVDEARYPTFNEGIRDCLRGSFCHLVIDEAFDMNSLDIAVVERAIEAGLSVTLVGDPWQSLYEFRGSTPKLVSRMITTRVFSQIDMPGEHRYRTREMSELAAGLFRSEPFSVTAAQAGDSFDVVLAHDWGTLWTEPRISVLPAGKWAKVDRGFMASAFVLLLGAFVHEHFGMEASGVTEARRALSSEPRDPRLKVALDALSDTDQTEEEIWAHLREAFQPPGRTWPQPGATAKRCMEGLVAVAHEDGAPLLGLSVHQAKGLEWERVLFLDPSLTTDPGWQNVLDIDELSHRNVYVALTRARSILRVASLAPDPYGAPHSAIKHVRRP
jgi:DNA helicase-2/ATP-dependent DNA helicase PcrA